MAKYKLFLVFFVIIALIDFASSFHISREAATTNIDDSFLVICKVEAGESVTWEGPSGALNKTTRPQVKYGPPGPAIFFNKTKTSDTGNYTCISTSSPQVRRIFSLKVQDFASSLYISQEAVTKDIDESFLVICKDEAGQSVTWIGPEGTLNKTTRPQVQRGSYGTAIFFNKTKTSDTGNYTCILTSSPQVRRIFSLKVQDFASSLYLSQEAVTRNIDESYLVICKDEAGQSVTWIGPEGTLNGTTRPQVRHGSYGTAMFFSKIKMSDMGNYTCILTSSPQVRRIFSIKVQG